MSGDVGVVLSQLTLRLYNTVLDVSSDRHALPISSLNRRYLRQAFSSLAHLYDSLSQTLGGSWEGDMVLSPGLRALEKVRISRLFSVRMAFVRGCARSSSARNRNKYLSRFKGNTA